MNAKERKLDDLYHELETANPVLHPAALREFFPAYRNFQPVKMYGDRIFASNSGLNTLNNLYSQGDRILLGISGFSAAGKDHIREELEKMFPDMFYKLITATTRPIRTDKGEVPDKDYFFYDSVPQFLADVSQGKFVEKAEVRPGVWYGLPTYSLEHALSQPAPILTTHTEISGWQKLRDTATELDLKMLTTFLFPNIPFNSYLSWLKEHRSSEYEDRVKRTIWELAAAPAHSDLIIINTLDPNKADEETALTTAAVSKLLLLTQDRAA